MKRKRYSVPKEEKLEIKRWDPIFQEKPYQYEQEWDAEIQSVIDDVTSKKERAKDPEFTGPMADRRRKAVLSFLPRVISQYGGDYPGKEQGIPNLIGQHWIRLNYNSNSLALLEKSEHILFAASFWILDQVCDDYEKRNKLFQLLPKEEMLLDKLTWVDAWSPDYDDDLVLSVEYVLHYRNEDIQAVETDKYHNPYVLTDSVTAKQENRQAVRSRETFEKMIELIPEKKIQEACLRFKAKFWEWVKEYYAGLREFDLELCTALDRANRNARRHNQAAAELEQAVEDAKKQAENKKSFPAGPFRMDFAASNFAVHPATLVNERMEALDKIDQAFDQSLEKVENCLRNRGWYSSEMSDFGQISTEFGLEYFGDSFMAKRQVLSGFDPFELCFALVWLIDQQDDLPWLSGAVSGFMAAVGNAFPWAFFEYDELEDPVWMEEEDGKAPPLRGRKPEIHWTDRIYADHSDDPYDDNKRSLTQIIYEDTGCLLPRDMDRYDRHRKELARWGIAGKDAMYVLACMNLLSTVRRRHKALNLDLDFIKYLEDSPETSENPSEAKNETKTTEEDLHSLSRERLEALVLEGRKNTRTYDRSLRLMEQNYRKLKREKERGDGSSYRASGTGFAAGAFVPCGSWQRRRDRGFKFSCGDRTAIYSQKNHRDLWRA